MKHKGKIVSRKFRIFREILFFCDQFASFSHFVFSRKMRKFSFFFEKFRFNLFYEKMRKFRKKKCENFAKKNNAKISRRQFIDLFENSSTVKIFLLKTQNKVYYGKNQNNSEYFEFNCLITFHTSKIRYKILLFTLVTLVQLKQW